MMLTKVESTQTQRADVLYRRLCVSDRLVAKVLRVSEVSQMARAEQRLRQLYHFNWEERSKKATKKASSLARSLKSTADIVAAINTMMGRWAPDVTPTAEAEVENIYRLARTAGLRKAIRDSSASLQYNVPNYTAETEGGQPPKSRGVPDKLRKPVLKAKKVEVVPSFDLADEEAIAALKERQTFWVGRHYNHNVAGAIREGVNEAMIEAGRSPAVAGQLVKERVREILGTVSTPEGFRGTSKQYWEMLAANTATVARVQGQLRSFADIGITRYTIVNPGGRRICPRCAHIQGKTFTVKQGLDQMAKEFAMDSPDDVRRVHPWKPLKEIEKISPKPGRLKGKAGEKDSAALAAAGFSLPPYHGRCRCTVDISDEMGSYKDLEPMNPPTRRRAATPKVPPPPKLKESAEDKIVKQLWNSRLIKSNRIGKGINQAVKGEFVDPNNRRLRAVVKWDEDGDMGIRKQVKGGTYGKREELTYKLDRALGGDPVVPPTVHRVITEEADRGAASIQHWIDDAIAPIKVMGGKIPIEHASLKRIALLDFITGNDDRHSGNLMYKMVKGKARAVAIDNGLTYPNGIPERVLMIGAGTPYNTLINLDAATHQLVKNLDLTHFAKMMADSGVLEKKAMRGALVRARAFQKDPNIIQVKSGANQTPHNAVMNFYKIADQKPHLLIGTDEMTKIDKMIESAIKAAKQ